MALRRGIVCRCVISEFHMLVAGSIELVDVEAVAARAAQSRPRLGPPARQALAQSRGAVREVHPPVLGAVPSRRAEGDPRRGDERVRGRAHLHHAEPGEPQLLPQRGLHEDRPKGFRLQGAQGDQGATRVGRTPL